MGQGSYTAIVFGVIDPPTDVEVDGDVVMAGWYERASRDAGENWRAHFACSREAEPFYRGVTVAVSDRALADRWDVPLFACRVLAADRLVFWVYENAAVSYTRALAAWAEVQTVGLKNGVDVPSGKLLLVCDRD